MARRAASSVRWASEVASWGEGSAQVLQEQVKPKEVWKWACRAGDGKRYSAP